MLVFMIVPSGSRACAYRFFTSPETVPATEYSPASNWMVWLTPPQSVTVPVAWMLPGVGPVV
ncbi:hypothetical protein [Bifidobacterium platyrrhinorum]|uniref:Uncharacterized protein n=1 Tax=Bifidobacterium platyrrhinorum TaxID=2661628 RepID=A0A6L9SVQ3_9BIFI|nr:hypothetical protein [Bifidobacterium platyrrhinorum]NEG56115.1 hypothetical protein [Bifidobacterium platyrrhinorum]